MLTKNTQRTPEYIYISRNIRKCENATQLNGLKELTLAYHKDGKQDGGELLLVYIQREAELSPDLNTIIDNPKFNINKQQYKSINQ